jgi:hypothetical protein
MSTVTTDAEISATNDAEPQPWRSPEDAKKWRPVARGQRRPGRLRIAETITLTFDPDRAAWLRRESERRGIDYDAVIMGLVDAARRADHS